jgi:hypothetical protein
MIHSDTITHLFDPLNGGPPRAYECKLDSRKKKSGKPCGMVTRTLSGMYVHQRRVHKFVAQSNIAFPNEESCTSTTASD